MPETPYSQLLMRKQDLTVADGATPPEGYAVRAHRADQHDELAAVLAAAFPDYEWTADHVCGRLVEAPDVEAVYVVEHEGLPVATASARYVPEQWPDSGYVHWVGCHPAHWGRGLGRLITLRVLEHFAEMGRKDAVLETDDPRLPAIRIYLGIGFQPEPYMAGHAGRWEAVMKALTRP